MRSAPHNLRGVREQAIQCRMAWYPTLIAHRQVQGFALPDDHHQLSGGVWAVVLKVCELMFYSVPVNGRAVGDRGRTQLRLW